MSNNLTITVRFNARLTLLLGAFGLSLVALYTFWSQDGMPAGTWGTIFLISTITSVITMIFWLVATFERFKIEGNEISYRYFLFVTRKADRATLDQVYIGEKSGALRFIVNGRRFASLNFGVIDITREEFEAFAKQRNIPIEYEER
ncbi:MAG: hypothetical protein FWD93_02975 [Coriobacteriia bacterium]|nr:hypothetical protein [Coriobacteriia bacterium]